MAVSAPSQTTARDGGMKLTASAPSAPELLAMSEEEQAFLRGFADEMICILEDAERSLVKKLDSQMFDMDEHLAAWSLLPAKVRTAITRGRELDRPKIVCQECGVVNGHMRHCSIGGRFA